MPLKQRAEPLAPEDRRQAIVEAVIPLLERGEHLTTAQIAEAAGIAEGTIFRVFPDKPTLLYEAITRCFDPAPALEQLANIEPALPLEIRLRKAAAIIVQRSERIHALTPILRSLPEPAETTHEDVHKAIVEANSMITWALTRIFRDDSDRLAIEPARAAAAFRGLLFAVSFPFSAPDELITADEAIQILLVGVCRESA
ncbi:MAG TPA: TetR/AcrR family transcriptional regulator [Acidimicrobiia bacterium]|nr:TetR/AcrR family transcriptional regulator [Acidimicrobiia bacterium]